MKKHKWMWILSCCLTASLWGEPGQDSTKVKYHLPPVVVTATKIPVLLDNVAASVSVVESIVLAIRPPLQYFLLYRQGFPVITRPNGG